MQLNSWMLLLDMSFCYAIGACASSLYVDIWMRLHKVVAKVTESQWFKTIQFLRIAVPFSFIICTKSRKWLNA